MYSHRDNCYDDYFYFIKNIYNLYIDYLISDFYNLFIIAILNIQYLREQGGWCYEIEQTS